MNQNKFKFDFQSRDIADFTPTELIDVSSVMATGKEIYITLLHQHNNEKEIHKAFIAKSNDYDFSRNLDVVIQLSDDRVLAQTLQKGELIFLSHNPRDLERQLFAELCI